MVSITINASTAIRRRTCATPQVAAHRPSVVVIAGLPGQYQGTTVPAADVFVGMDVRKGARSGPMSWSPPV